VSGIVVREAREADLPAIVALLAEDQISATPEDPSEPLDPGYAAALRAIAADPNEVLAVAELDGQVVGTLQLSFLPGLAQRGMWRGQIEAVRVSSMLRSKGLGKEMIEWAVAQCRARGCGLVQLTSNNARTRAHTFYEKLGWAKSHAGFKLKL